MTSKYHKERMKQKKLEEKRKARAHNIIRFIMLMIAVLCLIMTWFVLTNDFGNKLPDGNYRVKCIDGREQVFNISTILVCDRPNPLNRKNDNKFNISFG